VFVDYLMQWVFVCSKMYAERWYVYLDIRNNYGKKFTSCSMFLLCNPRSLR